MEIDGNRTPSLVEVLADDTSKGAFSKDRFYDRIERYGDAKNRSLAVSDYINEHQPNYKKLAHRVSECGSYLVFRDYYTVGEIRLSKACFCKKHLLCALCAIRRGAKLLSRYIDRFHEVKAANGQLTPYLVTFTVKDGDDLSERFNHLQKSIQAYHKRRHRKNASCEAVKAHGAVWSYEVKRGKNSGDWHPHVHAIWLCESPPSQEQISSEWRSITGDSYIVDVREINTSTDETTVKGFLEVFKYAVKFSDQSVQDTWHCHETLSGRRLIGSFGSLYGVPEPEELSDDPLEELPYVEYFYKFVGGKYRHEMSLVS